MTHPTWASKAFKKALDNKVENCESDEDFGTLSYVIGQTEYELPSSHFMEIYRDDEGKKPDICSPSINTLDIEQVG